MVHTAVTFFCEQRAMVISVAVLSSMHFSFLQLAHDIYNSGNVELSVSRMALVTSINNFDNCRLEPSKVSQVDNYNCCDVRLVTLIDECGKK